MGAVTTTIDWVRKVCLDLPEVQERLSHGAPTFFIRGKASFVVLHPEGHHDNQFPQLWCAAPDGVQGQVVAERPDQFFRPPYVGHRGWLGVRLDRGVSDEEMADLCEEAYRMVAPAALVRRLDTPPGQPELTRPASSAPDATQ
jgi:hypothetical protein